MIWGNLVQSDAGFQGSEAAVTGRTCHPQRQQVCLGGPSRGTGQRHPSESTELEPVFTFLVCGLLGHLVNK